MAKILQVIDVDSGGYSARLDDGRLVKIPHSAFQHAEVGTEFFEAHTEAPVAPAPAPEPCAACAEKDQHIGELARRVAQLTIEKAKSNAVDTAGQSEAPEEGQQSQEAPAVE